MLSNLKGYYHPKSIAEALALLEKNSGSILVIAGGTKLVQSQNDIVQELVDITTLPLNYIKKSNGTIRIGAVTPLQSLGGSPLLLDSVGHILADAALLSNHSQMIRNVSTVGGELVSSGPLSVLYCALLVLQGQVRIAGGEEFALPMNIFLNKKGLGGGLLVETVIPQLNEQTYSALAPIINNRGQIIICACARLTAKNGSCKDVKVAITGCPKVPQRLDGVEKQLEGQVMTEAHMSLAAEEAYEGCHPISDDLASEEYRKEVSRVVVKKALLSCLEQAEDDL